MGDGTTDRRGVDDGLDTGLDIDTEGVSVRTHPGVCLGWGNCHRFAPDIYPLDADGKVDVHVVAVPPEHAHDAWFGATACPEHAITVIGKPFQHWIDVKRRRAT